MSALLQLDSANCSAGAGFSSPRCRLPRPLSAAGRYSDYYKSATASIYPSSDSADDMAWAAAWLYRATGNTDFLAAAERYLAKVGLAVVADWDSMGAAVAVMLSNLKEDGIDVPGGAQHTSWVTGSFLKAWTKANGGGIPAAACKRCRTHHTHAAPTHCCYPLQVQASRRL